MAVIKPFKGLRYSRSAGNIKELCCPPYDIINETERQRLLDTNPYNIIRLEKPEQTPDGYKGAGQTLRNWVESGVLADDSQECIYAYEFSFVDNGVTRPVKGFVALVKVHDFSDGVVLPHEETLSKAKTDRFSLMTETGCNFSQIYSLYQDSANAGLAILDSVTKNAPNSEFTDDDNVTHRLWAVDDSDAIAKIVELMGDKKVYIADGHHRYETAIAFRDANTGGSSDFVPMFLVNMENPGLTVWPTHRIVRDLPDFDYAALIERSREYFDITEGLSNTESLAGKTNAFMLYYNGKYTLMVLKDKKIMDTILADKDESLRKLDVSVLHSLVLERLLGIDKANMAAQINLTYTRDFNEAIESVDRGVAVNATGGSTAASGVANCSFLLNPTPISEISTVASTGQKMPQKSTYFYPKLTTGLVMNRIFK
jgi:uncharacterized protein (DUF1015 family)